MGTITMSGFNSIDWGMILEAVMKQESQPLTNMQSQRTTLESKITAFSSLATKLGALESAAQDLTDVESFGGRTVTSADETSVAASSSSTAAAGTYDVVVTELARAQVTTLGGDVAAPLADKDQTVVATGGNLTFLDSTGAQVAQVSLADGSYTLEQLASAINAATGVPARATIVHANGEYKLVLTGTDTGLEHAFTAQNNLTGGPALVQATAMSASDADFTVNNVRVTSATNVIADAIDGVTLTLLKKTGTNVVPVTVAEDPSVAKTKVTSFITAYNALIDFASKQAQSARDGDAGNIGYDPLLRSLRATLSRVLSRAYDGGALTNLSQIGIEFNRSGKLELDSTIFDDAMKERRLDVERLLAGATGAGGAFDEIEQVVNDYSKSGGLVLDARTRLEDQVTSLDGRISAMEERLAQRRKSLQAEYAAADSIISQLNSQGGSLAALLKTS